MPDKKIKLLHLHAPLRFGGGEVFLSNFYEASGPWFENRTILFSRSDAFAEHLTSIGVPYEQFYNRDLAVGSMRQYIKVLQHAVLHPLRFKALLGKFNDSDFVIGHGFPFTAIIPIFRFIGILPRGMRVVHFQHHRLRRPVKSFFWKSIYHILLGSFDVIVVDSILVKDDIVEPLPRLSNKIFIIGIGIPFRKARKIAALPPGATSTLLRIAKERMRRTVSIYASRYVPHKNHKIFIDILEELRYYGQDQKLFLVLTGQEIIGSDFQKEVESRGFGGSVLFTGSLTHDEIFSAMKLSHICLFPSLEEGFGLSALEALVMGLPTLAFKDTMPEELGIFLILANSEKEFKKKALEFILHPEVMKTEKEKLLSKEDKLENYDIDNILSRFRERLDRVIAINERS